MDIRNDDSRDQNVEERAEQLNTTLHVPPEAASAAARDQNSPQPTRKPASEDVELARIASAQAQNAADDARK